MALLQSPLSCCNSATSLVVALAFLSLMSSLAIHCDACSCPKANYRENFCLNNFAAIVTVNSRLPCADWSTCYGVSVVRLFKPLLPVVGGKDSSPALVREIVTANTSIGCGHEFILSSTYLVMGSLIQGSPATKVEVYSCSYPIEWTSLKFSERKNYLSQIKPNEACKKKRKRVLSRTEFNK